MSNNSSGHANRVFLTYSCILTKLEALKIQLWLELHKFPLLSFVIHTNRWSNVFWMYCPHQDFFMSFLQKQCPWSTMNFRYVTSEVFCITPRFPKCWENTEDNCFRLASENPSLPQPGFLCEHWAVHFPSVDVLVSKQYCILCHPCLGNISSGSLLAGQEEKREGVIASLRQWKDTNWTMVSPQHR